MVARLEVGPALWSGPGQWFAGELEGGLWEQGNGWKQIYMSYWIPTIIMPGSIVHGKSINQIQLEDFVK